MNDIKTQVLSKIKSQLNENWMSGVSLIISEKTKEIDQTVADKLKASSMKSRLTDQLRKEASDKFLDCWTQYIEPQISVQYDKLHTQIESQLLDRHPWLSLEVESEQLTIKNLFLSETLQDLLFKLLDNKPQSARDWKNIGISTDTKLSWQIINQATNNEITCKIEGYPLSEPKFYNNRSLPNFLSSPLTLAPTRYDIYRLLKKAYTEKFTPKKLTNNIICTKIAPLNFKELSKLDSKEWAYFDTILVNIGVEEGPEWVLLNKKNEKWTLYVPDFLKDKAQDKLINLPELQNINIYNVDHSNCNDIFDWHAVLLSRVLPWSQKNNAPNLELQNFRNNVPIYVLKQHTIESSCLEAQKDYIDRAKQAFALSYPLSEATFANIYENQKVLESLLPSVPTPQASTLIEAFEQNKISYDGIKLTINDKEQLIEAMKLSYHLQIAKLSISTAPERADKPWFTFNLELTTIDSPSDPEHYGYIHACAARNRFINANVPRYLSSASNKILARKSVWENTGRFIYDYFKDNENLDLIQLENIAEMGKDGLDNFFAYLNTKETPNLSCAFSLNPGKTIRVYDYIQYLEDKIKNFKACRLFNKLELILPRSFDKSTQDNFFELLKTLNNRQELTNIIFKSADGITAKFLEELNKYVAANKLWLQIVIPEWDVEDFGDDSSKGNLKAKYREVQNTILENIRATRQNNLDANTKTISAPEDVLAITHKNVIKVDASRWVKIQYQLASSSIGVQQQAQQEVAQEAQQKQDKQSKAQPPVRRAISVYKGQLDKLITRRNLVSYNILENDFSAWVGSKKDAPFIIQKLDEAAYEQLKKYPNIFKFGIDPDRTPGFRLFYTSEDDKSLILSFNQELVEQDLLDLKEDVFAVRMNKCKEKTDFYGDFRQFLPFAKTNIAGQVTSWHYLSEEKEPSLGIKNWLQNNALDTETSETMQLYNYANQVTRAADQAEMLSIIKSWSKIKDEGFLQILTNKFNHQNLQAFGQLFYHYGETGNEKWLELTYKVYQRFPDKFKIFKERLLDPLLDWSECLEQKEVKALTASVKKLENEDVYSNILWTLIDKHGETVGRMYFAEVWQAYEKIIDYISTNDLEINQEEFLKAIQNYHGEFNATQFLRRIFEVFEATGNRRDSALVQQEILDNLSKIDWHESGFYYACSHENYRYWDDELKLKDGPSYISIFDNIDLSVITDINTHSLRYAAARIKLNKDDFNEFKALIRKVPNNINLQRLISASIAIGLDSISDLKQCDFTRFDKVTDNKAYDIINKCLILDEKDLKSHTYHVRFADLPILLEVLSESNTRINLDLETLNSLGRALQSYKNEEKKQKLKDLLAYGFLHGFNEPLITSFPWLIDEQIAMLPVNNKEVCRFYEQLRSIDFKGSTFLPNRDTLTNILFSIHTSADRRNAIKKLIELGCRITDQDAEYRILNSEERKLTDELYLAKTFKTRNIALLNELFEHLAVKQGDNEKEKILALLKFFGELDRKSYYNELGQLLGLLVEKSKNNQYYSVNQLTTWLSTVLNEELFKNNPYPVTIIKELLNDALSDKDSSLISNNLHHLKAEETSLDLLHKILGEINVINLSFEAKDTLVKSAIKFKKDTSINNINTKITHIFNQIKKSAEVTNACATYINQQLIESLDELQSKLTLLEKLTLPCPDANLQYLCESNQFKLLEELIAKTIDLKNVDALLDTPDIYARMILLAAFSKSDDIGLINKVKINISRLNSEEKQKLAQYYVSDPRPTLKQLDSLLNKFRNTEDMINHFEMVVVSGSKRDYSLTQKDARDILRVLNGITLNKQPNGIAKNEQTELLRLLYHCNNYSQTAKLQELKDRDILALIKENKKQDTPESKARILACIREMIVRKTGGKWINHTQMLVLIYSALHNDDSLLHQVHMGEGKSIIGVARDVYLALHGEIVDVYSSKESLSMRDHLESKAVLDAFGIRNAHITATSNRHEYFDNVDVDGIGAVHYATIGNFSLFYSGVRWENKDKDNKINVFQKNRRARCDEGDYVMRSENTLFNFSDQGDSKTIYNYDAWVYQIAYDYYIEHQNKLLKNNLQVLADDDLKNLYLRLEKGAREIAPNESTFFRKYLATGDDTLRNTKLVGLLTAAHLAQKLENGVDFCIMSEQKKINETSSIDTRFAKVMINNQVYHNSTYSELVHQFLHVRLNTEAIRNQESPNFFIEPESEIALSANAKFILKNYYHRIEAMTGTAGDQEAVRFYRDEFGVFRVVKYPTHEAIKTTFLPPIYEQTDLGIEVKSAINALLNPANLSENEKNELSTLVEQYISAGRALQVQKIVESIRLTPNQPILITCEDEKEVEILGRLIIEALGNHVPSVVIDTNARGISEADILKDAGAKSAITISARLGRGSDIKPYDTHEGLKVLRTYPATPDVVKQEEGRQGRHGAGGTCQDIINYNAVLVDLYSFETNSDFKERLGVEKEHLTNKLNKHQARIGEGHKSKPKWEAISGDEILRDKYLNARTLQYIKQKIKNEIKDRMSTKDNLLIEGSAQVMEHLFRITLAEQDELKRAWKLCRRDIETHWQDDDQCTTARQILNKFYSDYGISSYIHAKNYICPPNIEETHEFDEADRISKLIVFHQTWLTDLCANGTDQEIISAVYGVKCEKIDDLYRAFHKLNNEQLDTLSELVSNNYQLCHRISCEAWTKAIDVLIENSENFQASIERVKGLFRKNTDTLNSAAKVEEFSQKFLMVVEGSPEIDFLLDIISDLGYSEDIVKSFDKDIVYLCKNCMNEEDINFFLTTLQKSKDPSVILRELKSNYHDLKINPAVIRPLIALLGKENAKIPFEQLNLQEKIMPGLLQVLSKRPNFEERDVNKFKAKIDRIIEPINKIAFLAMLATLPPHVNIKSILQDLGEYPSKYFDDNYNELKVRTQKMHETAILFNDFLFANDIIQSMDPRDEILDEDTFKTWQDIYLKMSLEHRKIFFTEALKLNTVDLIKLKVIAENYILSPNNKLLSEKIMQLQSVKNPNDNKENVSIANPKNNRTMGFF